MEYTNITNLKSYLEISDNSEDLLLSEIIKKTTKLFDNYLWQNLWEKTYWEYIWEVFDDYVLFPKNTPIQSITEVRVDEYSTPIKRFIEDIVYLKYPVTGEVFMEYKAWYQSISDIPDVEEACQKVCKGLYEEIKSVNNSKIKSEKIDELSITYFSNSEKWKDTFDYKEVLDRYRNLQPNLI